MLYLSLEFYLFTLLLTPVLLPPDPTALLNPCLFVSWPCSLRQLLAVISASSHPPSQSWQFIFHVFHLRFILDLRVFEFLQGVSDNCLLASSVFIEDWHSFFAHSIPSSFPALHTLQPNARCTRTTKSSAAYTPLRTATLLICLLLLLYSQLYCPLPWLWRAFDCFFCFFVEPTLHQFVFVLALGFEALKPAALFLI